jgi:hypothetical protein
MGMYLVSPDTPGIDTNSKDSEYPSACIAGKKLIQYLPGSPQLAFSVLPYLRK